MRDNIKIGNIYYMKFDGDNSEQRGWRPGVVIQNNIGNRFSPNIIAVPLTTSMKKISMPTHVVVEKDDSGLSRDSVVLCENPQHISKDKLGSFIASLPSKYMKEIAVACSVSMPLISFLDLDSLLELWSSVKKLSCMAFNGSKNVQP